MPWRSRATTLGKNQAFLTTDYTDYTDYQNGTMFLNHAAVGTKITIEVLLLHFVSIESVKSV
jgi:hypothetical protein